MPNLYHYKVILIKQEKVIIGKIVHFQSAIVIIQETKTMIKP